MAALDSPCFLALSQARGEVNQVRQVMGRDQFSRDSISLSLNQSLNVIVIAIRWYLGETSYGVTYLQMVWIQHLTCRLVHLSGRNLPQVFRSLNQAT